MNDRKIITRLNGNELATSSGTTGPKKTRLLVTVELCVQLLRMYEMPNFFFN